jgi:hypothetical protein
MDATYGNIRHPIIAGTESEFSFLYPSLYFFDQYSRKHGAEWDINAAGDFWHAKSINAEFVRPRTPRVESIGFKYLNKSLVFILFSLAETINLSKDVLHYVLGARGGQSAVPLGATDLFASLRTSPRCRFSDVRFQVRSLLVLDRLVKRYMLTFSEFSVFAKLNSEVETAFSLKKFALVRSYVSEVCKSRTHFNARNAPIIRAAVSPELTFARFVSLLFLKKQLTRAKAFRPKYRYGGVNFSLRRLFDAIKLAKKWEIISYTKAASPRAVPAPAPLL